jgi:energy-coupling factor transporter ATP-binding protein EcfA2
MATKRYEVFLQSPASTSYRCQRAAQSVDLDVEKKLTHTLALDADLESPFNVGLIVGASGSGKTTLARQIYGDEVLQTVVDPSRPIIEQLPEGLTFDECVAHLSGVGLHQVPCWIRPVATLSNGQKFRAEVALQLALGRDPCVIDEWTSVVDRAVAKAMSHTIQKHARRTRTRVVLLSCHYDVMEWLQPDWVIDCNKQTFTDWRAERPGRQEKLVFTVAPVESSTWKQFSKYHYLSDRVPGGYGRSFGLFHNGEQIGFQHFAEYVPWADRSQKRIVHSNRTVIHPDYCGLGLGMKVVAVSSHMMHLAGHRVMAKFSSAPIAHAIKNDPYWKLLKVERLMKVQGSDSMGRVGGFRKQVKTLSYEFVPDPALLARLAAENAAALDASLDA